MRRAWPCLTFLAFLFVVPHLILAKENQNNGKPDDVRLIELNETTRQWMTEDQILDLIDKDIGFIDVTDAPDFGPKQGMLHPLIPSALRDDPITKLLEDLNIQNIAYTIEYLSTFFTRHYATETGKDAAVYLHNRYAEYIGDAPYASVSFFEHTWLQPSVIARIQGKGPNANELVIIGGHEDSINGGPNGRAPGADDDASGSSTVLEIFRVLTTNGWGDSFIPDRTIEFHAYAAEEVGLRGSSAIAQKYQEEGKVVAGMLQLDMTGYIREGLPPAIAVVTDYTNPALNDLVRKLVNAYTNTTTVDTRCGYGCSDHASWTRAGYPAAFPFETKFSYKNPAIHKATDLISNLKLWHAMQFARLGLAFAVQLGLTQNSD